MRNLSVKSIGLALAISTLGATAAVAGPFGDFGGSWKGAGRVTDVKGATENLSCKSNNTPSPDGIAMSMSLVCAADSYRVDFHADLYTDGQELRGTWSETSRGATGNVRGQITPALIKVTTTAPGFSASVVIHVVGGKRLDVSLNAQGTSVNHVEVSMKR